MARLKRIDLVKERDGIWVEHPDGFSIKVRSYELPDIQECIAKEMTEAAGRTPDGKVSDEVFVALMARIYAEKILIDWKDIDQAPEFSKEKALEFMSDPELRGFQMFVTRSARNIESFHRSGVEKIAGN